MPILSKPFIGLSGAIVSLVLALLSAFLWLDKRVDALSNSPITFTQVEHIIDLKTTGKLDEILRRLDRIERDIDRLGSKSEKLSTTGQGPPPVVS